ncbi:MAG: thioredoxin-dependent thiol peroxidase [Synechococcus sp.]|nr:thioredoxin-dependent thiol peroxidase [Synechococcus sp.]
MPLQIGDPAPDFTLPDQQGNPVALNDLRGQRVVIYFYPKDDTPGCTKEACNFRDQWDSFSAHGIKVLGISKDNAKSHLKFIDKYSLPFTLLSDPQSDDDSAPSCPVATAYESYGLKKFMGREYMGMMRHTFVIDADGKIEKIYKKVKAATMADDILNDLGLAG